MTKLRVTWVDSGREPTQRPDPAHPDGIDLDLSKGQAKYCETDLPYPAKRIGAFLIRCQICGLSAWITTAGRADDPRSIKLACKLN